MNLIDNACYTLPGGTVVRARVPLIGSVRLETMDGQLAYLFDVALSAWRRLTYNAATEGYEAAACDLVDADIEPVRG